MPKRIVHALLNRLGVRAALQEAWRRDLEPLAAEHRKTPARVEALETALEGLAEEHRKALRRLRLVEATLEQNRTQAPLLDHFRELCASGEIERHVRHALSSARVVPDPTPHLIVPDLFPQAFYDLCLQAIPPEEAFADRDHIKQNFKPRHSALLPDLGRAVWTYLDTVLIPKTMAPVIGEVLAGPIRDRYAALFGETSARELLSDGLESSSGRLMLRRPGYTIAPHFDVSRAAVTALMYFARPGDDPAYGTQLFRVQGMTNGSARSTYYPESDGATCELAVTVPFQPNTAFVWVNAGAAHGASIPRTAPKDTCRYSYQFYVGAKADALRAAVSKLPEDEQQAWAKD